jgi:hypothetical protein
MVCSLWVCSIACTPTKPQPSAPPETTAAPAQKATAGVGKKGQSLRDNKGVASIISMPAATFFNVEQKMVLDVQVPKALQLFQATEGRFPKSHEEFMQKIVQANQFSLPELPAGAVYHFDSEKGELWVYPEGEVPK